MCASVRIDFHFNETRRFRRGCVSQPPWNPLPDLDRLGAPVSYAWREREGPVEPAFLAHQTLQGLLLAGPLTNRQDRHRINAFPGEEFKVNPAGHGLCAHNDQTERSLGHRFDRRRRIQPCREVFHGHSAARPSLPRHWGGSSGARLTGLPPSSEHDTQTGDRAQSAPCDDGRPTRCVRPWARPQEDLGTKTT